MILYLRYCCTGVLFDIAVYVKDHYVTTYDDVILVKPNRISYSFHMLFTRIYWSVHSANSESLAAWYKYDR